MNNIKIKGNYCGSWYYDSKSYLNTIDYEDIRLHHIQREIKIILENEFKSDVELGNVVGPFNKGEVYSFDINKEYSIEITHNNTNNGRITFVVNKLESFSQIVDLMRFQKIWGDIKKFIDIWGKEDE